MAEKTIIKTLYNGSRVAVHPETDSGQIVDISRQPSTAYAAGAIVMGSGLASGLVLRCTAAGTTSSSVMDFSTYSAGDSVTDGTATWLVVQQAFADGDAFYVGADGNWCPNNAAHIYSAYFDIGADGNLFPV